jgi:hypothetical protein
MFHTVIVYTEVTEDECKIYSSNFDWFDRNRAVSCIFAVPTSQKGESSSL